MPRLVAISCVRNERDIIEAFVRHHAHLLDLLIVHDNGSTDGTYEDLCALRDEGIALIVRQGDALFHQQGRTMTALLDEAVREYGADWVFPLDADEFLEPESGRSVASIMAVQPAALLALRWVNFAWRPPTDADQDVNPLARLKLRTRPRNDMTKLAIPANLVDGRSAVLDEGNHDLFVDGMRMAAEICRDLTLCHFPIRSVGQYASKVAVAYLKHAANADGLDGHGGHHTIPFLSLCDGLPALEALLDQTSRRYSLDPTLDFDDAVSHEPFRYAGGAVPPAGPIAGPLRNVLIYADGLAHGFAAEVRAARAAGERAAALQISYDDIASRLAACEREHDLAIQRQTSAEAAVTALRDEMAQLTTQTGAEIARLNASCSDKDAHIAGLSKRVSAMLSSTSWRLTAPMRALRALPANLTRRRRMSGKED